GADRDADPVPELRVEVALEEVRRLHDVHVAVDEAQSILHSDFLLWLSTASTASSRRSARSSRSLSVRLAMGCGVARNGSPAMPHAEAIASPVARNGSVTMAIAGVPARSIRIASSTLLELHDPQSPMPEITRSLWRDSAGTTPSSISWLGERL